MVILGICVFGLMSTGARAAPVLKAHTLPAYGVNASEAVLVGHIRTGWRTTGFRFQWGTTQDYGHFAPYFPPEEPIFPGNGEGDEVNADLVCLDPGTTYHFRIVAYSHGAKAFGGDKTFTTKTARGSSSRHQNQCPKQARFRIPALAARGVRVPVGHPRIAGTVIACLHKGTGRLTPEVEPSRCDIAGHEGEGRKPVSFPVQGIGWNKWGRFRSWGARGVDTRTRSEVRVIAFRRVSCADGRTWYSAANVVDLRNGNYFVVRLPTCRDRSIVG